ncbi:MAG: hypothetical protein M3Y50_06700 [Acidobacteriota bacterium]|nr:hypothetical protein [Acidobacteriota bacterium]
MPAQPQWFPRLTQILTEIERLEQGTWLDRQAVERLFDVKDRRARNLIRQFGGDTRIGNAWAIQRERLIAALKTIQGGDDFEWDHRRRRRVADVLEQARREHPARQVEIRLPAETRFRTLASLPSAIQLAPGELRIQFGMLEELLTHLVDVAQALTNDFESFEDLMDECALTQKVR